MSHFVRELSDDQWAQNMVVDPTTIRNIDEKTKKAISETGGTYNPSAQIIVAGAGMELQGRMDLNTGATANPAAGKNFIFGDDDYFKISGGVSRSIVQPVMDLAGAVHVQACDVRAYVFHTSSASVRSGLRPRRAGIRTRIPLRIPDGSSLTSCVVQWRVNDTHLDVGEGIPSLLPMGRVVRVNADGVISAMPGNTTATAQPDGWVAFARPASVAAYYNGGAPQNLQLDFSAGAERVNRALYDYALEWREEDGPNRYTSVLGNDVLGIVLTVTDWDLRPY